LDICIPKSNSNYLASLGGIGGGATKEDLSSWSEERRTWSVDASARLPLDPKVDGGFVVYVDGFPMRGPRLIYNNIMFELW